jgi:heme/copper-type cytochrome/quinol oxidase subunit 2
MVQDFPYICGMDAVTFLNVFVAVIAGNGITIWLAYCVWRMRRNEDDHRANATFLGILAVIGVALYASLAG